MNEIVSIALVDDQDLVREGVKSLLALSGRVKVVLEARDGIGGRIASFAPSQSSTTNGASDRFDLGPAWFWPGYQPELDALVTALGLPRFTQFETGDMLVERTLEAIKVLFGK